MRVPIILFNIFIKLLLTICHSILIKIFLKTEIFIEVVLKFYTKRIFLLICVDTLIFRLTVFSNRKTTTG